VPLSPGWSISRPGTAFSFDFPTAILALAERGESICPKVEVRKGGPGEVQRVATSTTRSITTNETAELFVTLNGGSIVVAISSDVGGKKDQWSVSFYEQAFMALPALADQQSVTCKSYNQNGTTCRLTSDLPFDVPVHLVLTSLLGTNLTFTVDVESHTLESLDDPTFSCDSFVSCADAVSISDSDIITWQNPGNIANTFDSSMTVYFSAATSTYHQYGGIAFVGASLFLAVVLCIVAYVTRDKTYVRI